MTPGQLQPGPHCQRESLVFIPVIYSGFSIQFFSYSICKQLSYSIISSLYAYNMVAVNIQPILFSFSSYSHSSCYLLSVYLPFYNGHNAVIRMGSRFNDSHRLFQKRRKLFQQIRSHKMVRILRSVQSVVYMNLIHGQRECAQAHFLEDVRRLAQHKGIGPWELTGRIIVYLLVEVSEVVTTLRIQREFSIDRFSGLWHSICRFRLLIHGRNASVRKVAVTRGFSSLNFFVNAASYPKNFFA